LILKCQIRQKTQRREQGHGLELVQEDGEFVPRPGEPPPVHEEEEGVETLGFGEIIAILARSDLPKPLRRVILEQRDTVVRTLRARERDAQGG
jgi:hypothetical protein